MVDDAPASSARSRLADNSLLRAAPLRVAFRRLGAVWENRDGTSESYDLLIHARGPHRLVRVAHVEHTQEEEVYGSFPAHWIPSGVSIRVARGLCHLHIGRSWGAAVR